MNRRWLFLFLAIAAVAVLWFVGSSDNLDLRALQTVAGLKPNGVERAKSKPICASPVNPNVAAPTDCIPQHLANLPPDPGPAGMKTLEGIDSDRDGVRDDVQRFIVFQYGHSERAVMALRTIAKGVQQQVLLGDSVSRDQAKALAEGLVMKSVDCYSRSVDPQTRSSKALSMVVTEVTNTPERYAQKRKFEVMAANSAYLMSSASESELCGYDPSQLPN